MDETKKLNIIAIGDSSLEGAAAEQHGRLLALIFNASFTIVRNFHNTQKSYANALKINELQENGNDTKSATAAPTSSDTEKIMSQPMTAKMVYDLAEETNTALIVIGVAKRGGTTLFSSRQALAFIKPSRVPVLTVSAPPVENGYKNVLLPLDIHRNSKEKALWAGYFSRFYGATVHILHAVYRDKFLKQQLHDNLNFIKKLYANLEVHYDVHPTEAVSGDIDQFSLRFAPEVGATLTVIMTTRYRSFIDLLFGVKEKALICNAQKFPVLCINEREDLYVLCT